MSGQKPVSHGVVGNYETWLTAPTLPGLLTEAGYQTQLCGKLHLWPLRKRYGFEAMDLADGPGFSPQEGDSDYIRFIRNEGLAGTMEHIAHGIAGESCFVRPWHLDEHLHITNWTAARAIDFLARRDPTVPFFLNVSFFQPHPPITPPRVYVDRYLACELDHPVQAGWSSVFDVPQKGMAWNHPRQYLHPNEERQYRAAYYASINHIDDQIQRIINALITDRHIDFANTLIVFTSDHGEMLGDHQWTRKHVPYQGSVRVPLIMHLPRSTAIARPVVDAPVELMDIMPTILDIAGIPIPSTVDGKSMMPLISGKADATHEFIHGELHHVPSLPSGMHYVTDGKRKYVWYPGLHREEYFDLEHDPHEQHELLSEKSALPVDVQFWRDRLISTLAGRPEGFTDGRSLLPQQGPTAIFLPGHERDTDKFNEGVESR